MKFQHKNLNKVVATQRKNNRMNFFSANTRFLTKRLFKLFLEVVLITWAVYTVVFVLMNLPYMLGLQELIPSGVLEKAAKITDPVEKANFIAQQLEILHLDKGFLNQYIFSVTSLFDGTMGTSWSDLQSVSSVLWGRLFISATIGFIAVGLSILIGLPVGIFLARRQGIISDFLASIISVIAFSVPSFVVALLMVFFNSTVGLPFVFEYGNLFMYVLASLAIAIPVGFGYTRYLRTSVRQEYSEQYVALARVKGVKEEKILKTHILKPALFPIINYLPFVVVGAFFGSITIESVFAIPGSGQMLINSALEGDQPTVLAITTLYTFFTVISFFVRDLLITFVDPRIKGE